LFELKSSAIAASFKNQLLVFTLFKSKQSFYIYFQIFETKIEKKTTVVPHRVMELRQAIIHSGPEMK
jgi:hypothetical protein